MGVESTVMLPGVEVVGESDIAVCCRITARDHWIAPHRLLAGTTVAHFGDRGFIVVTAQFARERGLGTFAWQIAPR